MCSVYTYVHTCVCSVYTFVQVCVVHQYKCVRVYAVIYSEGRDAEPCSGGGDTLPREGRS